MLKALSSGVVALLLLVQISFAEEKRCAGLSKVNSQLGFTISGKYFKYDESIAGQKFMETEALLPGVSLFFNHTFKNNIYVSWEKSIHYGNDGKYKGGIRNKGEKSYRPYSVKKVGKTVTNLDLKGGYVFNTDYQSQVIPYLAIGAGKYQFRLNNDEISNYKRLTRSYYAALGAIYNVALTDEFVLSPEISIGKIKGKVGYGHCGGFFSTCKDFDLNSGMYYKAVVSGNYFINKNLSINGRVSYKYYKFGYSKNELDIDGRSFIEPPSTTQDITVGAGMSYHF